MKIAAIVMLLAASGGTMTYLACGGPGGPGPDPLLDLFDTDHNEEISSEEIDAAASVLRARDENGDGLLTRNELPRPPRRGDHRRPPRDHHHPDGDRPQRDRPDDRPQRPEQQVDVESAAAGTVIFRGGHETDSRDGGRPVSLIAAALDVSPEVFRAAFSGVTPSRSGPPSAALARANKTVLLDALGPHGVTNDRLDEVSNYYRYNRGAGEVWRQRPARARAIVQEGEVTGFEILDAGRGYTTAPTIVIAGHPNVTATAEIEFTTNLETNGRVKSISINQ
jgi:hypothetical protein